MIGSLISLAAGDAEGVISTACFISAELGLARKGRTVWGYSLSCAAISIGDGLLCFSHTTAGNLMLKITLAALTIVWALGALRWPIERFCKLPVLQVREGKRVADVIQPIVGTGALALRLPALYTRRSRVSISTR